MSLDDLRERIDGVDGELVRLLNERARLAVEIGRLKLQSGDEVYTPAREKAVLDRVARANAGPLPNTALNAIYREIMSAALALERPLRIAYLGPVATFTHQAARLKFGASVEYVACETITDVFAAVEKREADYGVVPIENSTDGAVTHTLDQFAVTPLKICAEILLPVSQNLMAADRAAPIRRIYSRGEVFAQCRGWLQGHLPGVELTAVSSTARGAELARTEPGAAAIASALAAEIYGLQIAERDVQDVAGNTTRFLVLGRQYGPPTGRDRTSLYFAVPHRVGALHRVLSVFNECGVNLCKIESRPNKTRAWEYFFFVDVEGHAQDAAVQRALEKLAEHCTFIAVLGSYPQSAGRED